MKIMSNDGTGKEKKLIYHIYPPLLLGLQGKGKQISALVSE